MKFPEPWTEHCAELLRAFTKEGVEYLLIGSMAESHGVGALIQRGGRAVAGMLTIATAGGS